MIELTQLEVFSLSMFVLFLGNQLSSRIRFLQKYNIPDPVVGGLAFSLFAGFLYFQLDITLSFGESLKNTMMLAFFATIGLSANAKLLKQGGAGIFRFVVIAILFLFLQNIVGVLLAKAFSLDPRIGLFAGSITLSGGHGTGAIYAAAFPDIKDALEIAMACATFGLVLGGILGGPLAERLISKYKLTSEEKFLHPKDTLKIHGINEKESVTAKTMMEILLVIALCVILSEQIQQYMHGAGITSIPTFVYTMFLGIFFTNFLSFSTPYRVPKQTVELIGVLSLSVFLAIALMSLKIWALMDLAGPLIVIILVQTLVLSLYAYFVTFRFMGKNYESAVIASGHMGFGLGAMSAAVANMETMVFRYGAAPQAFLTVPIVGAFFIDAANAGVIQLFLSFLN